MEDIINIDDLHISFGGAQDVVCGLSMSVRAGEVYALIGESGCGKSVSAQALLGLNASPPAKVSAKALCLGGTDVLTATEKDFMRLRGGVAAMIFQDPMSCLNPSMRVGRQITERLRRREGLSAAKCREEAGRLLELVQMPDVQLRMRQYPHELSGGMRQRAMIAMALAGRPQLLIADEPTTALDVTTQLQILRCISHMRDTLGSAVLLITHDMSVVASLADRVGLMFSGRIVEEAEVNQIFSAPAHPYTWELLAGSGAPGAGFASDAAGCAFAPRCPYCMQICLREPPPEFGLSSGHKAACWLLHKETLHV